MDLNTIRLTLPNFTNYDLQDTSSSTEVDSTRTSSASSISSQALTECNLGRRLNVVVLLQEPDEDLQEDYETMLLNEAAAQIAFLAQGLMGPLPLEIHEFSSTNESTNHFRQIVEFTPAHPHDVPALAQIIQLSNLERA